MNEPTPLSHEPWLLPPCDPDERGDDPIGLAATPAPRPRVSQGPPPEPEPQAVPTTDAALAAWRAVTVSRKAAWDAAERHRRARAWRVVGAFSIVGLVAVGGTVGWALDRAHETAPPQVTTPLATPVVEAPVPPARAAPAVVPTVRGPEVVPGSALVFWSEGKAWAQVDLVGTSVAELRWADAAGRPALDPWPCRGRRNQALRCLSTRWPARLDAALAAGAAPGLWTVSACADATGRLPGGPDVACTPIGTLPVPQAP